MKPAVPFRKSLSFRVLVMTIILLPLPLLVDAFVYLHGRYREGIKETKLWFSLEGKVVAYLASRQVKSKDLALQLIEDQLDLKNNFPKEASKSLDKQIHNIAEVGKFEGLLLLKSENNHFTLISSNLDDKNLNQILLNIANTQLTDDELAILYKIRTKYYFVYCKRIYSADKKKLGGILYANDVTNNLINDLKPRNFSNNTVADFAILNKNMIVKFSLDHDLEYQYFFPLSKKEIENFVSLNQQLKHELQNQPLSISFSHGNPFITYKWKNKKWLGIIQSIPDTKFYLLTSIPLEQVFVPQLKTVILLYSIYILILIIGSVISTFATLRIAKPLKNLSVTMEGIQKGNLESRYKNDPLGFEINFLGQTFNNMVDHLLEKQSLHEEEKVKTERYNKELIIGQQIQRSLLPEEMPFFEGVSLDARYLPAKEVGGDFYDVFKRKVNDEELVLVVADASGKGVGACFYSLGVRSYIRTFANHYQDVASICEKSNHLFSPDCGDTGMFVTAFVAIYNSKSKILSWASCGHPPMFIRRRDGSLQTLSERSMALGVDENMKVVEKQVQLFEGDLVFLYSDGATDDQNENGELYGEERLMNFVKKKGKESISKLSDELIEEFKAFQGKALQYDDITLLLMKLL